MRTGRNLSARLRIRFSCLLQTAVGIHQIADQHLMDEIGTEKNEP